ncbi:MAG: GNAT family N-acetyltransferase [Metallibacterium sp.]
MHELLFRPATPADAEAVVALVESAYRGDASRVGWTTEADLLDGRRTDVEAVLALIHAHDSMILLAQPPDAQALLACCHLARECGDNAYFGMFAVRPGAQGGGVGRRVLAEAERIARETWQCTHMAMTVIDARAELIAWYERRGYHRTGEYKPFPYGDARFGIPRRADLRFELLLKPLAKACA